MFVVKDQNGVCEGGDAQDEQDDEVCNLGHGFLDHQDVERTEREQSDPVEEHIPQNQNHE